MMNATTITITITNNLTRALAHASLLVLPMLLLPATAPATDVTLATPAPKPVLVELFTSEGCSSCPPADALLRSMEKPAFVPGVEIVPLSLHVDYWNRLGWVDPFSSRVFGERQEDYRHALGTPNLYTPQMVVDGRAEVLGSDEGKARRAITNAVRAPKARVEITSEPGAKNSDRLTVRITASDLPAQEDTPEVWVALTESGLESKVSSGENSGRRLGHTAVVRTLKSAGTAKPVNGRGPAFDGTVELRLSPSWIRDKLRVVAFAQERKSRHVLGVAVVDLGEPERLRR